MDANPISMLQLNENRLELCFEAAQSVMDIVLLLDRHTAASSTKDAVVCTAAVADRTFDGAAVDADVAQHVLRHVGESLSGSAIFVSGDDPPHETCA
jgi:hypothetical protein